MKESWALADLCHPPNDYNVLLHRHRYCRSHIHIAAAKFIMRSLYCTWRPLKAHCCPPKASVNVCSYWPLNYLSELNATKYTWIKPPLFHRWFWIDSNPAQRLWKRLIQLNSGLKRFQHCDLFNADHLWNGWEKGKMHDSESSHGLLGGVATKKLSAEPMAMNIELFSVTSQLPGGSNSWLP